MSEQFAKKCVLSHFFGLFEDGGSFGEKFFRPNLILDK